MVEVVEQLHEQGLPGVASAHKSEYREHVELNDTQFVVGKEFLEIASHRFGIWIFVNNNPTLACGKVGKRLRFGSVAPGLTNDDKPATLGEILQEFALYRSQRVEFDGQDRLELRQRVCI